MGYLTIGANNLDNRAIITSVNVRIGRSSITQQPQPGTFTCSFYLGADETIYPVQVGTNCDYYVYDSTATGSKRQVFAGTVTDVQINLNWANGTGIYEYNITAVDGLAALSKYVVGSGGYSKQYEGSRIKAILNDITATYGQVVDQTDIESPGSYELAVYNSGQSDAYTLCTEAANSAMGTLYWNQQDFRLKYVSYLTRKSNTQIILDEGDVLAGDFSLTASSNEICNATQLTYGTGSLSTQYQDATSIGLYGAKAGVRNTTLHNVSDANSIAQILLETRKDPNYNLTSITLNTAILSDSVKTELAQLEVGTRIAINSLPTTELTSFYGFVEGYTWTAARGQDIITMTLSATDQQYAFTLWSQLNGTDTWNTFATSTTQWGDLT